MTTKLFKSMNLIRRGSGANLNISAIRRSRVTVKVSLRCRPMEHPMSIRSASDGGRWQNRVWKYAAVLLCLLTIGVGNAWASHDQHTATLNAEVGTGSGTVYASTSSTATTGSASASFNCGKSINGQHTGDLYAFATPAAGYTFLGWTTSKTSTEGADKTNPKSVAFDVTDASNTQTLYAHFVEKAKVNITFEAPSNGTYTIKVNGGSAETVSSSDVVKNDVTDVTLTATPASGYAFAGWYKLNSAGEFVEDLSVSSQYDASFTKSETIKMGARFVPTTLGKFILKGSSTEYYGLKAATVAAGGSGIIVPVADETLVDGSDLMPFDNGTYTIKAGATLLVPHTSAYTVQVEPEVVTSAVTLSAFRTLVLKDGASIVCNGNICVGGKIMSAGGGNKSAYVTGPCGVINMANGGHIELNSGAKLYCWGFIKGQDMDQGNNTVGVGTITANSGSVIWENFEVGDWRGGTATSAINDKKSSWKLFPFQSYSIQNIEVPTTYKFGSKLSNFVSINSSFGTEEASFDIIGSSGTLFLLKDAQSLVRKWYDPTTDLTCYELSGTAQLDALNITVYVSVSSSDFYLPISNSMHIILKNCNMTLSKPITMQAGSVIEIKEDATANLEARMHVFDKDDWGLFIHNFYFRSFNNLTSHKNRGAENSNEGLEDGKIIVDGTLNLVSGKGYLYSTNGGANIMGNGGGKVVFGGALPSGAEVLHHVTVSPNKSDSYIYDAPVSINTANLCNEDGSYTKAIASTTFHNVNGRWFAASAKDEQADHTYNFTYMASGNSGDDVNTPALYGEDKTGLTAGMKWCNVAQDGTCPAIYNATQDLNGKDADSIRYTYQNDAWLQLLKTETENVYGGSDNDLYALENCVLNSLGSVDENCLYTINDVKKALVNGKFVALAKNTNDEAFHNTASTSEYYISFAGCTWHPATKYAGEEKAYIVEGGIYIWYNNDWLLVEHEDPFFFDYNEQNVKRYYEYENGEWVLADPKVRVTDAIETRDFFFLSDAINVASGKKNATITILKDISGIATSLSYTAANTTCTLDLNGHTVQGTANKLLNINGSGSTFTITDSQTGGTLKMTGTPNNACYYNVYVTNGSLVLNKGIISVDNAATYSGDNYALCAVGVASGKSFTMDGGTIYARVNRRAYGIESNGTTKVNGGNITSETTGYGYPYGVFIKAGTTTITSGVTITANAKTTYAHPVYMTGGTLNVTGGTMTATAPTTSNDSFFNSAIRIDGGTANISNATLSATVTGNSNSKNAYGIYSKGTTTISNCVVSATTKTSGAYAVYTAGGTTTIKSGKFKASAPSAVAGVYKNADTITIEDGYFVQNINLEANLAANRGVYKLTSGTEYSEGYQYDIDKAYTLTWVTDGNDLTGNYTNGKTRVGATITKPSTPTKTGYTFKEWTPTPAATMPSEDKTYTATWTPNTNTAYTVTHYQQNIADDEYTLIDTDNLTGTTDAATEAVAKSYTGFTAQSFSQSTIAPDGSTTVSIYYNRDKFTIIWNNADGTTLETDANVKYGALPVYDGATPTKATDVEYAYAFDTWSPAVSAVTGDATYTATYTTTPVVASVTANSTTAYYTSFADAWTAANSATAASTLTLLQNISGLSSTRTYNASHDLMLDLNGHTLSGAGTITSLFNINCTGYTFTVTDGSANHDGKLSFTAESTSTSHCVIVTNGTFVLEAGMMEATSSTASIGAVKVAGGTFTMKENGAVHAIYTGNVAGKNSRIVNATDGTTNINGGSIRLESTKDAIGVVYSSGNVTFNGGRFKITASGTAAVTNNNSAQTNLNIRGGYYSANDNTYFTPHVKTPYHIFENADAEYPQKVAEGYTVTFKNGDVTLQSGLWEKAATPLYSGETPAKAADAQYTYTFDGWSTTDGGDKLAELPAVSANATYFARFAQTENKYTVSVAAGANGSVSPASVSEIGCETASGDITATPDAGYSFTGWTLPDGVTAATGYTAASNPIRIHAIAADKTITANFVARTDINYTVKHYQQNIKNDEYIEVTADQETKQGTTATATAATAKSYTGFAAQPIAQGTIAGDGSTVVSVYYNRIKYAVTWNWNESGTPTTYRDDVKYGAAPVYTYATPTKPSDGTYNYTFTGWSDGTNTYAVGATLPAVTAAITYTAHYAQVNLDLVVAGEYELPGTTAVTNVTVTTDGTLNLTESTTLTTTDLILEATESTAGEIVGAENLTTVNAYFDWTINAQRRRWYAVAVPWQVDAEDGIFIRGGRKLVLGRDFDLIYYNEAVRATNGANKSAWQYVEDDDDKTMQPGRFYMMAFAKAWGNPTTFRFTKKSGAPIVFNGVINVNRTGNDQQHSGWNGIANPALYRAYLNAGIEYGQVLIDGDMDNGTRYDEVHLNDAVEGKLPVSRPVFIQCTAGSDSTVTINRSSYAAPVRRMAVGQATATYELRLNATGTTYADRVFFRADDKADDRYTAGSDLMRMGIGKKHAQMWIAAYNQSLCVHTAPWDNEVARMPLTLYAPQVGDYTLNLKQAAADGVKIYLTYEGEAIALLTDEAVTVSLSKGSNAAYGIRIVRTAPGTVTNLDEAAFNGDDTQKVIINGCLYILREGKTYDAQGKLIQ